MACTHGVLFMRLVREVGGKKIKQDTVEPRYNEGPRDWQNLFAIKRFRYFVGSFLSYINHSKYYSFKIFPRFWLAESARLIHDNQLLMTKFGRILCLAGKWRQNAAFLQVNAPLTEKTWGRGWVVLVVNLKSGGDICYLENICGAEQP